MALDQPSYDRLITSRSAQLWFAAWHGARASCRLIDNVADEIPRARFNGNEFYLPQKNIADHRASSVHFYAHQRFGGAPFSTAKLRPIQIVLVSLFEDARVEQLAMRARPGLRRLWQPYIDALLSLNEDGSDNDGGDVTALLRRLTRALFDPAQSQTHPWVEKARRLFYERRNQWNDPALSRELGNWLGNDLGQMRLQFNWKSYVVEPVYRDDHRGLWIDDNDPEPLEEKQAGIRIDSDATAIAAAPVTGDVQARAAEVGEWLAAGASVVSAAVTLPEWDYQRQFYRKDWVSVREQSASVGDVAPLLLLLGAAMSDRVPPISNRLPATRRHRRAHNGETLDIEACIRLLTDHRLGHDADMRIYRRRVDQASPHSVVILLDTSLSMAAFLANDKSPKNSVEKITRLDYAKQATINIVRQTQQRGDRISIYGFCSDGRHALQMVPIKKFDENLFATNTDACLMRLAGLVPAYSTRLGGALRYTQQLFHDEINSEREIIVFGDGEVGDIDTVDPKYLYEDARQAWRELQSSGVKFTYRNVIEQE